MNDRAKELRRERNRRYYIKHADEERERARRWRQEHHEDLAENNVFRARKQRINRAEKRGQYRDEQA